MPARCLWTLLLFVLPACSTAYWVGSADDQVQKIVRNKREGFDRFREEGLIRPEFKDAKDDDSTDTPSEDELATIPRIMTLLDALRIATDRNREYQTARDSLYLSALTLTGVRLQFSVLFNGSISAILSGANETEDKNNNALNFGVSRVLPTGGDIRFDWRTTANEGAFSTTDGYGWAHDWDVSIDQPLLRDAGYETSHEPLNQAERNVVYAIRDFELFREDFTIRVASSFYALIGNQASIKNAEKNLASRERLMRESMAKFEVGLAKKSDALRSERNYLGAKSDLLQQKAGYRLQLDRFKILLGLPTSFPLDVTSEKPEFKPVRVDLNEAVEAALHNRVDLITARDQLDDAERQVRITVNRLLPELDLTGRYGRSTTVSDSIAGESFKDYSWTVGLMLEIPFQRTIERNAVRRSIIQLGRSRRSLTLAEDNIILEVRDSLRQLRRSEVSIDINRRELSAASSEVRAAEIEFKAGEASNLSVTEAQNAELRALNSLIRSHFDYEVARLQLLRDVGILFIEPDGMWVEP